RNKEQRKQEDDSRSLFKRNKEQRKQEDDSRSLFSIGSCTSLNEINNNDLFQVVNFDEYRQGLKIRKATIEKDLRRKNEIKNKTDDSPAERLMRMHRNFSSRSSNLPSSGSQQSPKSSPLQRRDEMEQLSRKRERMCFKNDDSAVITSQEKSKTAADCFAIAEEDKAGEDISEIIYSVQLSPDRPARLEESSVCLQRLLTSMSTIPPTNNPFEENNITQNIDVSVNRDLKAEFQNELVKMSSVSSSDSQKHCSESTYHCNVPEKSIDDERGLDF
ncbi:hypothetical protein NPIL_577071, partial [Nephila pilipes]